MSSSHRNNHWKGHAFTNFHGSEREGLAVVDRRGMIKAGLAGMAGLSLPGLLRARDLAKWNGRSLGGNKSVILLWMCGGTATLIRSTPNLTNPKTIEGLSRPSRPLIRE